MTKYLGLAIGPIYRTLAQARKTRHLWSASYMFSYLMKNIMRRYREKEDVKILLPYAEDSIYDKKLGVGLFSDRLLIEVSAPVDGVDYFNEMKKNIAEVLDEMNKCLDLNYPNGLDLSDILRTCFLEIELPEDKNPIIELSQLLDTLEQAPKYRQYDLMEKMSELFDIANGKCFYKDAGISFQKGFQSLPEIATADLRRYNEVEYDELISSDPADSNKEDTFIGKLKEHPSFKEHFKQYHKYVAIVKADGDKIGETIKAIGNNTEAMREFQKAIARFARQSLDPIRDFGGAPVYAGGDDLLFFAPIVNSNLTTCPTILHLVKSLSDLFDQTIGNLSNIPYGDPKPSISFGVSISFYKFPMKEALEKADELLNKAKDPKFGDRNAVAVSLQKHSQGRADEDFFIWRKTNSSFDNFLQLPDEDKKAGLLAFYTADERNRLHSAKYKIKEQKMLLRSIFEDGKNFTERLEAFFTNNFNESEHQSRHESYLKELRGFLKQVAYENNMNTDKALKIVENALDFLQFVNADAKS